MPVYLLIYSLSSLSTPLYSLKRKLHPSGNSFILLFLAYETATGNIERKLKNKPLVSVPEAMVYFPESPLYYIALKQMMVARCMVIDQCGLIGYNHRVQSLVKRPERLSTST